MLLTSWLKGGGKRGWKTLTRESSRGGTERRLTGLRGAGHPGGLDAHETAPIPVSANEARKVRRVPIQAGNRAATSPDGASVSFFKGTSSLMYFC